MENNKSDTCLLKPVEPLTDCVQDGHQYSKYVTVTKQSEGNSKVARCSTRVMQIVFDNDEEENSNSKDVTYTDIILSSGKERGDLGIASKPIARVKEEVEEGIFSPNALGDHTTMLRPKQEICTAYNDADTDTSATATTKSQGLDSENVYSGSTDLFQAILQTNQHSDMMKRLVLSMANPNGLFNPGCSIMSSSNGSVLVNSMSSDPSTSSPNLPGVAAGLGTADHNPQATPMDKKPPREKRHKCAQCGKSFVRSTDLKRHYRVHTGEKNHKCPVCEKAFSQSGDLVRHMLTHTGERPHVCGVCTKRFTQSGDLKIHMRIHTGEKPHVCPVCNKAFNQSSYLKTHVKSHTGERAHVCFVCKKAFVENSDLKKHMLIHTGEKPHQCSICNKAFNRNNNLIRHIMTIHSREKPT